MKKMIIYEPAMCCSTGLCGVSIDPELLRIATVLNNLSKNGLPVVRYNLSSSPRKFTENRTVKQLINTQGVRCLPITIVDNEVVKMKQYPSNEEIAKFLEVSEDYLCMELNPNDSSNNSNNSSSCNGGCC